jgi:DNA-directed RNA polymerase subunit RPC12/RpoP
MCGERTENMEGKKMSAREQLAYLRGLIEGQNIAENAGMSKFHEALLGVLDSITGEIDKIASDQADLRECVEELEDEMLSFDDDDDDLDDDDDDDDDAFDEDDEEEEYERVVCPECGKDFIYQTDVYDEDEDLLCPHCGKPFKR